MIPYTFLVICSIYSFHDDENYRRRKEDGDDGNQRVIYDVQCIPIFAYMCI